MKSHPRLPRGRHGIPPQQVVAIQRRRLLDATASLIAERGCCVISVSEIVERAGVSRRTFYQLFEDRSDCLLATQRDSFECLHQRITDACSVGSEWPLRVGLAVSAALEFAASNPDQARLALAPSYAHLEPDMASNALLFHRRLAALLEGSARQPRRYRCGRPSGRPGGPRRRDIDRRDTPGGR